MYILIAFSKANNFFKTISEIIISLSCAQALLMDFTINLQILPTKHDTILINWSQWFENVCVSVS